MQLDEAHCVEFLSYWVRYSMPMPVTYQKARTSRLVAVTFTIEPTDYNAMERAVSKTGWRMWNITKK